MADINLTQPEADALIAMEKHRINDDRHTFPWNGESLILPLLSQNKREQFYLDIHRGKIDLMKGKYQNRARQVFTLVRLDIGGSPHKNPDGEEIACPHLHVYKEGFADKWAIPVPSNLFSRTDDLWGTLEDFMIYCNITKPPLIDRGLFT